MTCFPDTSFLCALYRSQVQSAMADRFMAQHGGPLQVSSLLLLEFRQSVRLQVRVHAGDKPKGFARSHGDPMLEALQQDVNAGVLRLNPVDWAAVHQQAEVLSGLHTPAAGHRLVDILHVATAMHLGVGPFLTFDPNQRALAESVGLDVPL